MLTKQMRSAQRVGRGVGRERVRAQPEQFNMTWSKQKFIASSSRTEILRRRRRRRRN
jgi:hypothetical protein